MKYSIFVFGFVCLVLRVNGGKIDTHAELREKCSAEVGLKREEIAASDAPAFLQNPKSKCYLNCFLEGVEAFDENHSFDVARSVSLLDEEIRDQVHPLLLTCEKDSENITEKCEKAYAISKCLHNAAPNLIQVLDILERPTEA